MIAILLLALSSVRADTSQAGFHVGVFTGPRIGSELFKYNTWMDLGLQAGYADVFLRTSVSVNMFDTEASRIGMVEGQEKPELGSGLVSLTLGKQWRSPSGRWFAIGAGWGDGSADSLVTARETRRFVDLDSSGRFVEPVPCPQFPFGCDVYGWAWSEEREKNGPVVFGEVGWSNSGGAISLKAEYFLALHLSLLLWARIP